MDAGPEPCAAPGAVETITCGACGETTRFCTAERIWSYGPCSVERGECVPGSAPVVACGRCGRGPARCNASCRWEIESCGDEGACTPGHRLRASDGCPLRQTRELLCGDECAYAEVDGCRDDGCEVPGVVETTSCGRCGSWRRFCTTDRVWSYGDCTSERECAPGATTSRACGRRGTEPLVCTTECEWTSFGACSGEGECAPGERLVSNAGCPEGHARVLECDPLCAYAEVEPCTTRSLCPAFPYTPSDCSSPSVTAQLTSLDSDDDGLTDLAELCMHATNPCSRDGDGDGAPDLVEVVYGSDATDPADNPVARGDLAFLAPYASASDPGIPPEPLRRTLWVDTRIRKLDIYLMMDTSGSMTGEMANLRSAFNTVIAPQVRSLIPDSWFGAGRLEDCPSSTCANAMHNIIDLTPDIAAVQASVDTLTSTCGGSEPYHQTLWLLATGETDRFDGNVRPRPRRCTDPTTIGWPCFRRDALRAVVLMCDEPLASQSLGCSSSYPGRTQADAVAAMNAAGIRFIGIDSSTSSALQTEMHAVARATGAVDSRTDTPIYRRIPATGAGLDTAVVESVRGLTEQVPLRVDTELENAAGSPAGVDVAATFIARVEANASGASIGGRVCTGLPTGDASGDGSPDHFPRVLPGTSVCFDVVPRANRTVPATSVPGAYRARLLIRGDSSTILDERELLFVVPPVLP